MAGAFTAVDLAKLPFPAAVEVLDYEVIVAESLATLRSLDPAFTALVESDPAYKIIEVMAFRELLIRQRANEEVKAVCLAYAMDSDLDQIAARHNVERLTIVAADDTTVPPTEAVLESNESLRRRVQLSFEGFSTAGPTGAYIFHALGADPRVLDANAESPVPGQVVVAVLSNIGDGAAPGDLLAAVDRTLSDEDVRPLTDQVLVKSAVILPYAVEASLILYPGPDGEVVLAAAQTALDAYVSNSHRLGRDVTLSGLYAALHQEGVQNVSLISPAASVLAGWDQATWCTSTNITIGGVSE